jgi:hypothetical protein
MRHVTRAYGTAAMNFDEHSAQSVRISQVIPGKGEAGITPGMFWGHVFNAVIEIGRNHGCGAQVSKIGFQAWGRGVDQQRAISLGFLDLDDANQKRWVLKFDNAKTISQIDAVFITLEPEGGSTKPSGKPLLFTSLRIDPNHP